MGKAGKQAARNERKKAAAKDDGEDDVSQSGQGGSKFVELAKKLLTESMMAEVVPKLRPLFTEAPSTQETKAEPAADKDATEDNDSQPKDATDDKSAAPAAEVDSGTEIFNALRSRLVWHNSLGLAKTPTESWKSWLSMKGLELDWGPRPKKKGNPGLERVSTNMYNHLPQYVHILLVLMMLRSFLFRSYFACLPWLVGYQALSLLLPTEPLPQVPQLPLDQVPLKYRVAATACLHGLVLLFFLYELVWRTWFFEKFLVLGLVAGHAYVVRPADP